MPLQEKTSPVLSSDQQVEAGRANATLRLAFAREKYPELHHKVAAARLDLAAAIIAMDEAEDIPGRHNLNEQVAAEAATRAYAQALADLLRGEVAS